MSLLYKAIYHPDYTGTYLQNIYGRASIRILKPLNFCLVSIILVCVSCVVESAGYYDAGPEYPPPNYGYYNSAPAYPWYSGVNVDIVNGYGHGGYYGNGGYYRGAYGGYRGGYGGGYNRGYGGHH